MPPKKRKGNKYRPGSQWTKRQKTINSAQDHNSGVMFTCDVHRSREAKRDAFNLLNEAADVLDEALEEEEEEEEESGSSADASATTTTSTDKEIPQNDGMDLAAEIAALKEQDSVVVSANGKTKRTSSARFTQLPTDVKGMFVLILKANERHRATDFVNHMCQSAIASGQVNSRFLVRAYPLHTICRGREKDLASNVNIVLDDYFERRTSSTGTGEEGKEEKRELPMSFAIDYKGRHMGKEFRDNAITELANAVAARHAMWKEKIRDGGSGGGGGSGAGSGAGSGGGADGGTGGGADGGTDGGTDGDDSKTDMNSSVLKVDLTSPEFVVLCQAFSPLCGLTVIDGEVYRNNAKYNLTKLQGVKKIKRM